MISKAPCLKARELGAGNCQGQGIAELARGLPNTTNQSRTSARLLLAGRLGSPEALATEVLHGAETVREPLHLGHMVN